MSDDIDEVLSAMGEDKDKENLQKQKTQRVELTSLLDEIALTESDLNSSQTQLPIDDDDTIDFDEVSPTEVVSVSIPEEVEADVEFTPATKQASGTSKDAVIMPDLPNRPRKLITELPEEVKPVKEEEAINEDEIVRDERQIMISLRDQLNGKLKICLPFNKDKISLVPVSVNPTEEYKTKTLDLSLDFPSYSAEEYNLVSLNRAIELDAEITAVGGEDNIPEEKMVAFRDGLNDIQIELQNRILSNIDGDHPEAGEIPALREEETAWVHEIPVPGSNRNMKIAKPTKESLRKHDTVEAKSQMLARSLGTGSKTTVPLFGSGFWITLDPIAISDIAINHTLLIEQGERLGRRTSGYGYDTFNVLAHKQNVSMFLKFLGNTNAKNRDPVHLMKNISVLDLETIYSAALENMYPSGFKIIRRCINHACNKERVYLVKPAEMIKWDLKYFPEEALTYISAIGETRGEEEIEKYKGMVPFNKQHSFVINQEETHDGNTEFTRVTLSVPSLAKYFEYAESYIFDLEKTINETFLGNRSEEERNANIIRFSQTYLLRAYSHWIEKIESIEVDANSNEETINFTMSTPEEIKSSANTLSGDPETLNLIISEIRQYHTKSSYSTFGIPRHNCRHCDYDQGHGLDDTSYIIPLDILQTFFHLEELKLQKAQAL